MKLNKKSPKSISGQVAKIIAEAVDCLFTQEDFTSLPRAGVSIALSRLSQKGFLVRVARGVYYRSQNTVVGQTKVGQGRVEHLLLKGARPTGPSAAVFLGFSSKNPSRNAYAITQRDPSTRLVSARMVRQRPPHDLTWEEGAIMEFIRDRAAWSDLDESSTIEKLLKLCQVQGRFEKLAVASLSEPPRVRAILGAIGDNSGLTGATIETLFDSINPTSKFDFGKLRSLPEARKWRAT